MKKLRVGVIGCGWIAQNVHIPNYIRNPKSEIVALCDINDEVLMNARKEYGIENTFTDYHELFEKGIVDAVSICTNVSTHCEIATCAANHSVHVLCEKPLAYSMEEADKMIEAALHNKVKLTVGFNLRFLPNHRKMKEYLLSGKIGKPIFIKGEVVAAGPYKSEIPKGNILRETEKRKGALFDLGAHMADLFLWMLGKPKEVYALSSTYKKGVNVDDLASVLMNFESGVVGSMNILWANLSSIQAMENNKKIEIIGERGKIESDFFGPSLYLYSEGSLASKIKGKSKITPGKFNPKIPNEALEWSYRQEIESFLNSIVEDKKPQVTGEEAREALKLVLAAYESNETKRVIKLE